MKSASAVGMESADDFQSFGINAPKVDKGG